MSQNTEPDEAAATNVSSARWALVLTLWPRLQPYARIAGFLVTGAALTYVGVYLYGLIRTQGAALLTAENLTRVAIGSLVYALTGFLLAIAWINIVNALSDLKLSLKDGICIYAVTQVFKYLPSNVLHAVGRYGMTKARGLSHRAVLLAMGGEMLLISLAAATLVVATLAAVFERTLPDLVLGADWRAGVFAVAVVAGLVGLVAHAFLRNRRAPLRLGLSYLMFVAFFLISGMIAVGLLYGLSWTSVSKEAPLIIGAIAAAWLGGWVTPGASSGVGVREAIIILLLSPHIGGDSAALLAVTYRIVTTAGDLAFALVGLLMARLIGNGGEPPARQG